MRSRFEWQGNEQGLWRCRRDALLDWDGPLDVRPGPAHHRLPVRMSSGDPGQRGTLLELMSVNTY